MPSYRAIHPYRLPALATAGALLAGLAAPPALAHPHVWVTVETTLLFEQGAVTGIRHKWTFDEFYTSMAIQGLDTNNDGKYSREELAELAQVNIDGLKDFQFFTNARLAQAPLAFEAPKDYWLEHGDAPVDPEAAKLPKVELLPRASEQKPQPGVFARLWDLVFGPAKTEAVDSGAGKVLSLNFTLPLKQPVLADAPGFAFSVYDASFFIAFDFAKVDPVKLGPGAPPSCRIELGEAEKSDAAADAQRLGEAFAGQLGAQNFGFLASKPVRLACGPRS